MRDKKLKEFDSNEVAVTAEEVIDHMKERALKYPVLMCVLLQICLSEIMLVFQKSEADANAFWYKAMLQFLCLFCCIAHSTKYVSLLTDFFVEQLCMSDAQRALLDNCILFCKTVNGRNIFGDHFVEWMVRDLQAYLGHYLVGMNQPSLVQCVSLLLNKFKILQQKGQLVETDEEAKHGF